MKVVDSSGATIGKDDDALDVVPVENGYDRVKPRQIGTGIMRGQQGVGGTKVKIDSVNGTITVSDDNNERVLIGSFGD